MYVDNEILKKTLVKWAKHYGKGNHEDNHYWYQVQVACTALKIDFDEVLKYMAGKKSKFKPEKLK